MQFQITFIFKFLLVMYLQYLRHSNVSNSAHTAIFRRYYYNEIG